MLGISSCIYWPFVSLLKQLCSVLPEKLTFCSRHSWRVATFLPYGTYYYQCASLVSQKGFLRDPRAKFLKHNPQQGEGFWVPSGNPTHWPHWVGLSYFQPLLSPHPCWALSFFCSSFKTLTTHLSSAPARMNPTSFLSCHYQIYFPCWCLWHLSSISHFHPVCFSITFLWKHSCPSQTPWIISIPCEVWLCFLNTQGLKPSWTWELISSEEDPRNAHSNKGTNPL